MIGNPIGYPIGGDLNRGNLTVVVGAGGLGSYGGDEDRLRKLRRQRDIAAMRAKRLEKERIAAERLSEAERQRLAEEAALASQANQIIDLVAAMRDLRAAEIARDDEEILMLLLAA